MRLDRRVRATLAVACALALAAGAPIPVTAATGDQIAAALRATLSAVGATPASGGVAGGAVNGDLMPGRQRALHFLPATPADKVPVPLREGRATGAWPAADRMTTALEVHVWEFEPEKAAGAYDTFCELWAQDLNDFYAAFGGLQPTVSTGQASVAGRPAFTTRYQVAPSPAVHGIAWRQGAFIAHVSTGGDNASRLPGVAEALAVELERIGGADESEPRADAGGAADTEQPPATVDAKVTIERNPATGEPYAGAVADGRSPLKIRVTLGDGASGTLDVSPPSLGTLRTARGRTSLRVDSGTYDFTYTPPDYVPESALAEKVDRLAEGAAWAAVVPLSFTYTERESGRTETLEAEVRVVRTPVMLVHGFTGGADTWAGLSAHLNGRKYDTHIDEYYEGNEGIHAQAEALGRNIAARLADYRGAGFKIKRVDLVGHSMGGLISRTWVRGPFPESRFTGDVRKVIMVGTPNHGSSLFDKYVGNTISEFQAKHRIAAQQLYEGSAFMRALNAGEDAGRHLEPSVQYGCVFVIPDDWVVTAASSRLNGVASKTHTGMGHSPAIPWSPSITTSRAVWTDVEQWLSSDIPRAPLRTVSAAIDRTEGDVTLVTYGTGRPVSSKVDAPPRTVESFDDVETGPGSKARIRLMLGSGVWGTIDMDADTRITLGHLAPQQVTVRVVKGSARFVSLKLSEPGHFVATLGASSPTWYEIEPNARVIGLDTEFAVSAGETMDVRVLEGSAIVRASSGSKDGTALSAGRAASVDATATAATKTDPSGPAWWEDGFYAVGFGERFARGWGAFLEGFSATWQPLLQRLGWWRAPAGVSFESMAGSRTATEPPGTIPSDPGSEDGDGGDAYAERDRRAAIDLVGDFLNALREDRIDDARALVTDDYFSQGPANVMETNGDFISFEITDARARPDGTMAVTTSETWAWGEQRFQYTVQVVRSMRSGQVAYYITAWRKL